MSNSWNNPHEIPESDKILIVDLIAESAANPLGPAIAQFRVKHEDRRDDLDELENNGFIERVDHAYLPRIVSLALLRQESPLAGKLLDTCGQVFAAAREAYKKKPGITLSVEEVASLAGIDAADARRSMGLLAKMMLWSQYKLSSSKVDGSITPDERILDHKTWEKLVEDNIAGHKAYLEDRLQMYLPEPDTDLSGNVAADALAGGTISEVTRRGIADYWTVSQEPWAGRLSESAFMARLFDLVSLPSHDYRLDNAAADIRRHREEFRDWDEDWPFTDQRFNLLWCDDELFLRFLCETVHPVVRPNPEEARKIVNELNSQLRPDGWHLVESGGLSGRPIFAATRLSGTLRVFNDPTGWPKVDRQLQEVRVRLDTAQTEEQCQAVGLLCREVLISVGQTVFDASRHRTPDGVTPSETDAKRLLEAYFDSELSGSANEEARTHAKAAVRLALALQHKRTADYRTAALCAEASNSVANLVAILAKR